MYTLEDVYKTFPSGCTEDYKILRAFEMGKQAREKRIAELEKGIRCECTRCVYSDSPCIRSDYGVEKDEDACPNYENVFTAYTQLKKENAELRKEWQEQVQKATDEGYARTLQTIQLNKAKEIIKELYECLDKLYLSGLSAKQIAFIEQLQDKTEQFLSEVKE